VAIPDTAEAEKLWITVLYGEVKAHQHAEQVEDDTQRDRQLSSYVGIRRGSEAHCRSLAQRR